MPSYFRNIFGGGSNTQSSSANTKTRSRSNPPAAHIYATPPGSSGSIASVNMQRTYSYSASRSTTPSPLRYTAGTDTRTALGYGKRESRPQAPRRASYKSGEPVANYAMHTPSASYITPPSSRSNSSSSLFGVGAASSYRTSNSDSGHGVRYPDSRPVLRQHQTWAPGSSAGSASSYGSMRGESPARSSHSIPRSSHSPARSTHSPTATSFTRSHTPTLHMHPLFAYTRLHRAPLTYDVTFTPSARTVLDRATHSAIPSHTLAQPATEPPTAAGARLVLRSHKFPWPVVVAPSSAPPSSPGPRFTVAPAKTGAISNLDVLYAWTSLGHGSRAQQKVTRAYERRCQRMGGGWEGGVRRIDWLGEKTRLVGVEIDKSGAPGGAGKLVFGKA
ncbi:hypothetical protein B0H21DRAFT_763869 [Amylocystis lapponica]|nr:hypothetical protein B0H21DRAFT_763869 [Amylocystis lapponica]